MKPAARVLLNGVDKTSAWASVLESVTITDNAGVKSDTCELAFDNRERFSAPPIGGEIQVWLGYEPQPVYMGRYKVDSWTKTSAPHRLTVSAKAADMTGDIRAPKSRSFHEKKVKAIVEQVAGDHGLSAQVDGDIGGVEVDHIDQQTESDLSFLTRLAKRHGATFKLADGKVLFAAKGSRKAPSGKDKTPIAIPESRCSSWTANSSERGGFKSASTHYMDHVAGKRKTARVGKGKPEHRDRRLYGSKAEADAAAKANLGDLTRGKVSVTLEMPGDPSLYAEALITLIRLPTDHFAYVSLDKGFEPWGGGDAAPADWDEGEVLFQCGGAWVPQEGPTSWRETDLIIGYRKRAEGAFVVGDRVRIINDTGWNGICATVIAGGDRPRLRPDAGSRYAHINSPLPDHYLKDAGTWPVEKLERLPVAPLAAQEGVKGDPGVDFTVLEAEGAAKRAGGVFVKALSEREWRERIRAVRGKRSLVSLDILDELGLIREETRTKRFARETGHEITPAVEAALSWDRAA